MFSLRIYFGFLCGCWTLLASAQQPFDLDTTFRCQFNDWYVNSIMPLEDGTLLLSGKMRYPEVMSFSFRSTIIVDPNGGRIDSFPWFNSAGGGKLTRWGDKIYAGTSQTVRRLLGNGLIDTGFIQMNSDPLFGSLQGGDYHVYPDGSILMTGAHNLFDTARGFVGLYNLIWFTNTGRLDTTKIHRKGSGVVYEIEPLANGQFLCYTTGDFYEGQGVGHVFRVFADGSLDTTMHTNINWGETYSFLPLPDGRFYAAGIFSFTNGPQDIRRLMRFLPNGDIDTTFNNNIDFDRGEIPGSIYGATVSPIQPWVHGSLLVMGTYQFVSEQPRRGICVIDSTGQVLDVFDGCGVGTYIYQGTTYGSVRGMLADQDGMAYIWGTYHGYNDGTTNDTLQRFVTRLYGPNFPTLVTEPVVEKERPFKVYPNPASGLVTFTYDLKEQPKEDAFVVVKDAVGRQIVALPMKNSQGQLVMDTRELAKGLYTVRYTQGGRNLQLDRLIVE